MLVGIHCRNSWQMTSLPNGAEAVVERKSEYRSLNRMMGARIGVVLMEVESAEGFKRSLKGRRERHVKYEE